MWEKMKAVCKKAKNYLTLLAFILGILAFLMAFIPSVRVSFGHKDSFFDRLIVYMNILKKNSIHAEYYWNYFWQFFNILSIFFLPIISCVFIAISKIKKDKFYYFLAAIGFAMAVIFVLVESVLGMFSYMEWWPLDRALELLQYNYFPMLLNGIFSILAGVCLIPSLINFIKEGKKKENPKNEGMDNENL